MSNTNCEVSTRFVDLPDWATVRLPVALVVTGWKRTSFLEGVKNGSIPKPVRLGERAIGWRVGDLRAMMERLASQSAGQ